MNDRSDDIFHFLVQIGLVGRRDRQWFLESLKRARDSPETRLRHERIAAVPRLSHREWIEGWRQD
jgi:hypothetical protein